MRDLLPGAELSVRVAVVDERGYGKRQRNIGPISVGRT